MRQFTPEHTSGHLIRVYAGIEHGPDLWTDIAAMLDKLADQPPHAEISRPGS